MTAALRGVAAIFLFGSAAFCQTAAQCTPSQLKAITKGVDGGLGHVAYALEVTNTSATACRLEGVPEIQIRSGRSAPQKIPVCANCDDYLFQQRPSEPVILRRNESAYFLLGFTMPDETCRKTGVVQVRLPGSSRALEFERLAEAEDGAQIAPGFVPFCGTVNVSAWRPGQYERTACLTCDSKP